MDWALSGPIPWIAAGCQLAGTVHLGGTLAEVATAERTPWQQQTAEQASTMGRLFRVRGSPATTAKEGVIHVVYDCCCGMDVHAKTVVACLFKAGKKEIRTFSAMCAVTFDCYACVAECAWQRCSVSKIPQAGD